MVNHTYHLWHSIMFLPWTFCPTSTRGSRAKPYNRENVYPCHISPDFHPWKSGESVHLSLHHISQYLRFTLRQISTHGNRANLYTFPHTIFEHYLRFALRSMFHPCALRKAMTMRLQVPMLRLLTSQITCTHYLMLSLIGIMHGVRKV